ncbi:hypothetical protein RhiirC2_796654 [Rhizophagus irregularis]|uniref:Uncharacterized protein n=1 Tax=Rhizophagus irregularis TaxID=588596 RepID=A0A2N1M9A7_9GLOM|nr:hypothetical protein RhiirC2_796654 [Rhizophagus irregularis]
MERFYSRHLFSFAHKHSDNLHIMKRFLCPGWEIVNADLIQKTNVDLKSEYAPVLLEFLVLCHLVILPMTGLSMHHYMHHCPLVSQGPQEILHTEMKVKKDYQNGGLQLRIALDKFLEHYKAIQVESIKRRKIEESGTKRRLSAVPIHDGKENLDS